MNKNILSLNNHVYKLLGYNYDVNIIPKSKYIGWYESRYNNILVILDDSSLTDVFNTPDDVHPIKINPIVMSNLFSLRRHHKSIFNDKLSTEKLIVYLNTNLRSNSMEFTIYNFGIINSLPVISTMIKIFSTEKFINEFITTELGLVIEPNRYYVVNLRS